MFDQFTVAYCLNKEVENDNMPFVDILNRKIRIPDYTRTWHVIVANVSMV